MTNMRRSLIGRLTAVGLAAAAVAGCVTRDENGEPMIKHGFGVNSLTDMIPSQSIFEIPRSYPGDESFDSSVETTVNALRNGTHCDDPHALGALADLYHMEGVPGDRRSSIADINQWYWESNGSKWNANLGTVVVDRPTALRDSEQYSSGIRRENPELEFPMDRVMEVLGDYAVPFNKEQLIALSDNARYVDFRPASSFRNAGSRGEQVKMFGPQWNSLIEADVITTVDGRDPATLSDGYYGNFEYRSGQDNALYSADRLPIKEKSAFSAQVTLRDRCDLMS